MAAEASKGMINRQSNQEHNEFASCREKTTNANGGISLQECKGKESRKLTVEQTPSSIPKRR